TIASCQGHIAGHKEAPYIYFHASPTIAQHLSSLCRTTKGLSKPWEITGYFNENQALTFRLSAPYYDHHYLRSGIVCLGWHRDRIDADITLLMEVINITLLKELKP
ncbi:hypothetical protein L4D75_28020, partial [Photobacterium indicum]